MCDFKPELWSTLVNNKLIPGSSLDEYTGGGELWYYYQGPFTNKNIGGGSLAYFPRNEDILLSIDSYISHEYKGHSYGTLKNALLCKAVKEAGYKLLMCTVRLDNIPQNAILHKNGWKTIQLVGNETAIWTKDLT